MKYLMLSVLMVFTSCTSTEELVEATKVAQTNYNTCQANYYEASELVKIELTEDGKVKSMAVGNQNLQGCQMAKAPESVGVAAVKGLTSVSNTLITATASAVPYIAIGKIGVEGIKAAGTVYTNSNNVTSGDVATRGDEIASGDVITSGDVATRGDETIRGDEIISGDILTETVSGVKAGNDVNQNPVNTTETITTTTTTTTSVPEPEPVPAP